MEAVGSYILRFSDGAEKQVRQNRFCVEYLKESLWKETHFDILQLLAYHQLVCILAFSCFGVFFFSFSQITDSLALVVVDNCSNKRDHCTFYQTRVI